MNKNGVKNFGIGMILGIVVEGLITGAIKVTVTKK